MEFYDLKNKKKFKATPQGFKKMKNGRKAAYATHGGHRYYRFVKK